MLIQQCYKSEMSILLITLLNERRTFILIKVKYWGKKILHDGKNWAESAALSDEPLSFTATWRSLWRSSRGTRP